jgi:hypothetical protein
MVLKVEIEKVISYLFSGLSFTQKKQKRTHIGKKLQKY